ncbi:hypothetical protein LguiB_000136 [Lonicera macranthoides]
MAESEAKPSTPTESTTVTTSPTQKPVQQDEEKVLKYLDFAQVSAVYLIVCFSSLYEFAKENSGPLKPGVQAVEGTVKTVIGPVYDKFHGVPFQLLKFVDRKVDESINEVERHVPALLKQASSQAYVAAQKAWEVTRSVASEVHRTSVVDTATNIAKMVYTKYEPMAKELYKKYEPVAEQYAVSAWWSLNKLPLFPQVAHIVVPTAAYWSEKYNQAVVVTAERGYTVSYYLPLVPIEKISKVFEGAENEPSVVIHGEAVVVEQ